MLAVKSHLFLAAVLTIHIGLLAGFVLLCLRRIQPFGGLACGARRPGVLSIGARRRHVGGEIRRPRMGGGLDFDARRRRSSRGLVANAYHYGSCRGRLPDFGNGRGLGALRAAAVGRFAVAPAIRSSRTGGRSMSRVTTTAGLSLSGARGRARLARARRRLRRAYQTANRSARTGDGGRGRAFGIAAGHSGRGVAAHGARCRPSGRQRRGLQSMVGAIDRRVDEADRPPPAAGRATCAVAK